MIDKNNKWCQLRLIHIPLNIFGIKVLRLGVVIQGKHQPNTSDEMKLYEWARYEFFPTFCGCARL